MSTATTGFLLCDDGPASADVVVASYAHCRHVVRSCASSFYQAMRLIPEPRRSATYALYTWMRVADDLADGPGEPAQKEPAIERFWARTQIALTASGGAPDHFNGDGDDHRAARDALWPAFRDSCNRHRLSQPLLRHFIGGQLLDLRKTRYATFEELYDYCYKVASVVGLLCIEVWGYAGGDGTRRMAEWRGIAFQLTNILRDVREDALRGRVYLPADLTGGRALSPGCILSGRAAGLDDVLERLCERARHYYDASAPLDERVDPAGRACLRAMTRTYRGLLDKIACEPPAVLRARRVRLSRVRKLWIALRAACE